MVISNVSSSELIEQCLPMVKSIAGKVREGLYSNQEYDDLIAAGMLGLIESFRRFDYTKGVKYSTYAFWRIKGAMLDYLRKSGLSSRSFGDIVVIPLLEKDQNREDRQNQFDEVDNQEAFDFLMGMLEPRSKLIMDLHYRLGFKKAEIGKEIGLSGCRVAQIIKESLEIIREMIKEGEHK